MRIPVGNGVIELAKGDITLQHVDAIVNAANRGLRGGGGVDGAIHEAGGPEILAELKRKFPSGCGTGEAVVTGAGELRARFVIHAVGPSFVPQEEKRCAEQLRSAYAKSLRQAAEHGCRSVALPSISTGVFRYPTAAAARIALGAAREFLLARAGVELVRWVLYDDRTFEAYEEAAREIFGEEAATSGK